MRTLAGIRVPLDGVTLDEITEALGMQPDPHRGRGDRGVWHRGSGVADTGELEVHLEAMLAALEPRSAQVVALADRVALDVFVGIFDPKDTGDIFWLSPVLLGRLSALGIGLGIDVYPPSRRSERTSGG